MNKRADSKSTEGKVPMTVNILSNNKVSFGGKSVLGIIIIGVIIVAALVVSEVEPEALLTLIRSLVEAFCGS